MIKEISNAWICRVSENKVLPVFGDLLLENGVIQEIRRKNFNEYLSSKSSSKKNQFDAEGRVLTITNVNFHEHIYSRLAKGLPIKGSTDSFQNILKNIWWKLDTLLDQKMVESSAVLTSIESIKNGVAYIFDHHSSQSKPIGSLSVIAETLMKYELNAVLAFETTDRNKNSIDSFNENKNNLNNNIDSKIKYLFGLHASFTVNNETLEKLGKLLSESNTGIHIHLCEDKLDRTLSKSRFGKLPLQRLIKYNLLNEKSILSHSIHLSPSEYRTIAGYGSAIALNPDSNLNNSVGINDFKSMADDQILLCGTDGMNANPAKSLKNLFLLMRHSGLSNEFVFNKISKIYFDQIEFIRRFFPDYSLLNIGEKANFIIWDYIPPTPIKKSNFFGHYIYGIIENHVSSLIVNGNFLMKNKKLIGINESELNKTIYRDGKRLYNKFTKSVS